MENFKTTDEIAKYMISNNKTIRETALLCKISKSKLHKKLHNELKDSRLCKELERHLQNNFANKYVKGELATKRMWDRRKINE